MAIQQADKLLKKHKDLHCAKVGDRGAILLHTSVQLSVCFLLMADVCVDVKLQTTSFLSSKLVGYFYK